MMLILQVVLVMLATVVSTLVESNDLPSVPEDSEHMDTLEGSEPLPPPAARYRYATQELPHGMYSWQPRTVTTTEIAPTVTKTVNICPTVVAEDKPSQTQDYCNSNGQFLFGPTNECFKHLKDKLRSFEDADAQCRKEGMRLARPKKPKAIQRHLVTVLGFSGHIYIGARGDGQSFKWQRNGGAIGNTDPNWWTGMPAIYITTDRCLVLVAQQNGVNSGKVYYPEPCSGKLTALCQRSECSPECTIGTCTGPNTCTHDPRSDEFQNAIAVCNDGCVNGNCTAQCTCSDGYIGNTCDKRFTCHESDGFFQLPESTKCYKPYIDQKRIWSDADAHCKAEGLALAEPNNPIQLRKYLHENFGDKYYWLGGVGTGSSFKFQRGGGHLYPGNDLWINPPGKHITNTDCLLITGYEQNLRKDPSAPYFSYTCSFTDAYTLCEAISK